MYANRDFYKGTYHGALDEAVVEGYLERAAMMLDRLTFGRLLAMRWTEDAHLEKCVKMANCALADAEQARSTDIFAGGKVVSESVGKWSRSIQADAGSNWEARCYSIASQYIPVESGLLYRGVGRC